MSDAGRQRQSNIRDGASKKALPLTPIIRAIGLSLVERRAVDVALPIVDDRDALLNVARRLELGEKLKVSGLNKLTSQAVVLAQGHVYEVATHRPRTWRLRVLLSKPEGREGSRR